MREPFVLDIQLFVPTSNVLVYTVPCGCALIERLARTIPASSLTIAPVYDPTCWCKYQMASNTGWLG